MIKDCIGELFDKGFFVGEEIIDESLCENLLKFFNGSNLIKAGVGAYSEINKNIRGDYISWINGDENIYVKEYINFINGLKIEINKSFFMGLKSFEAHYAKYKEGGFYKKHLDNINGKSARKITCITYLNEQWREGFGGELVIYKNHNKLLVKPKMGTFVCFVADEIEHEVLPAKKERKSITGWLRND